MGKDSGDVSGASATRGGAVEEVGAAAASAC